MIRVLFQINWGRHVHLREHRWRVLENDERAEDYYVNLTKTWHLKFVPGRAFTESASFSKSAEQPIKTAKWIEFDQETGEYLDRLVNHRKENSSVFTLVEGIG